MVIKFGLELWCGNNDPNRYVYQYRGEVFGYENDEEDRDEPDVKIGEIDIFYVDRASATDDGESFFEVMDATSFETMECYEALIDLESGGWKDEVTELIGDDTLIRDNILLINRLKIEERFRGKGVGERVAHEVIKTFASQCAVIICKPFPLQYTGYQSDENAEARKVPGYERKRRAAFRKVASFWKRVGFQKLPSCEHYVYVQ